jgi:hypothetical protein
MRPQKKKLIVYFHIKLLLFDFAISPDNQTL